MKARIAAFLVWALVAACAVYWAMRLLAAPAPLPASVQPVSLSGALKGDIARLFASPATPALDTAPVEPALASRFKLVGVLAPKDAERGRGQGIALIAVDGKPPRPYRVGASLGDSLVLQAVAARGATVGPRAGPAALQLEIPALPPAATGTRPGALGGLPGLGAAAASLSAAPTGAGLQPGEAADHGETVEPEPPPVEEPPPDEGGPQPQPIRNLR